MIDFGAFYQVLAQDAKLAKFSDTFRLNIEQVCQRKDGNLPGWLTILDALPPLSPHHIELNQAVIEIGSEKQLNQYDQQRLEKQLRALMPWRKGPFSIFGIHIDTEWRSDWKWDRVAPHLSSLEGRRVLDVGAGSGYHCWRMYGAGASLVVGIDPWWLYIMQFEAIKHFIGEVSVFNLPLGIQDLPVNMQAFDTVFSMGVLYHRKSPIEHLQQLAQCLRPGGELLLETLVIEGGAGEVLVPDDRYAKMKNVWFIPSTVELERWLKRCGFTDIRLVDLNQTTLEEQRPTNWMTGESLPDFLNQTDQNLTIEGYPAPKRAVFLATRP
ncbi:MAG: tRNA 5-methoxyuridine(34)/uridine 5-oxyacetic acid(34) synthase CmoB [Gammaproteobacteria bacterium]|nr:tRNA 5-methoxyuridine(34)/uridine 5-oxyacetic acid(34) synthase CmoB [Gammaproteobacteria bacterium]